MSSPRTPFMKRTILILLMAVTTAHAGWRTYDGNSWKASIPDVLHYYKQPLDEEGQRPGKWHLTTFYSEDKSVSLIVYTHPLDPNEEFQTLHSFLDLRLQEEQARKPSSTILSSRTIGLWFQEPTRKASNFTRNCGDTKTIGSVSISPTLRWRRCR
jgi:hypothetical protein